MAKIQKPSPGTVAVRLDLLPADRDALRVLAAQHGLSMSAYARLLVEARIELARKKNLLHA